MSTYFTRVQTATQNLGRDFDEWCNVTFYGGAPGQTVSQHAAMDAKAGRLPGCILCALLSVIVQWRHCSKTLDMAGPPTPMSVYGRAGLAFLLTFGWLSSQLEHALGTLITLLLP